VYNFSRDGIEFTRGSIALSRGSIALTSYSIALTRGKISLERKIIALTRGGIAPSLANSIWLSPTQATSDMMIAARDWISSCGELSRSIRILQAPHAAKPALMSSVSSHKQSLRRQTNTMRHFSYAA